MPTPNDLAKSGTEHGEQVALFAWVRMATMRGFAAAWDDECYKKAGYAAATYGEAHAIPALKWFHSIPNGGSRGDDAKSRAIRGGQLKAEGQRNGVLDTFWPFPRSVYAGFYIEMKKRDLKREGKPLHGCSEEQIEFGSFVSSLGYLALVCYTWQDAAKEIEKYYKSAHNLGG